MPPPRVASIVLTYENVADTDECLRSLAEMKYPEHEIVLVDNGSRDGSLTELRDRWRGRVQIVETGRNLGGAAGWNAGIRSVLGERVDYFLVLNNDVVVEPSLINQLLSAFENHPTTALVSPVIVGYASPDLVWYAGGTWNRLFGYTRHPGIGDSWPSMADGFGQDRLTDYAPLCAAMISRAAFDRVGLFDEWFFFSHEDVDWCLRAKREGFVCRVLGRPLVRHKVSASSGIRGSLTFSPFSAFHFAAGSMKLGRKHYRNLWIVPYLAGQLSFRLPVYLWRMARSGQVAAIPSYFRGLIAGARAARQPEPGALSGSSAR